MLLVIKIILGDEIVLFVICQELNKHKPEDACEKHKRQDLNDELEHVHAVLSVDPGHDKIVLFVYVIS